MIELTMAKEHMLTHFCSELFVQKTGKMEQVTQAEKTFAPKSMKKEGSKKMVHLKMEELEDSSDYCLEKLMRMLSSKFVNNSK